MHDGVRHTFGFKGGCKHVTMQNSTLWADVAHPIFIGIHGDTKNPEVLEDLNYVNIDIWTSEKQLNYQGACPSMPETTIWSAMSV